MALPQLQQELKYSYNDYNTWDEGRWELIDGVVWDMTPAPLRIHQGVLLELSVIFHQHFKGTNCEVYVAPFDVRLPDTETADDYTTFTVVQPDISIICDASKLDKRGCVGAPDLIVEILSPSTAAKDLKVKRELYQNHGVKEYWLAHPTDRIVMSYVLDEDGKYNKSKIYDMEDILKSNLLEDLEIKLSEIFTEE